MNQAQVSLRNGEGRGLKVLMAVPQYPRPVIGGLEKQAHELAVALKAHGAQVIAVSGRIRSSQSEVEWVDGVEVHRLPWPDNRMVRHITTPFCLWQRARRLIQGADVVHTHVFSDFGLFVILLARMCKKPVMVKLPNVRSSGLPGLAAGFLGGLRTKVFSLADAVVALSAESVEELRHIGYDRRRILATPNGVSVLERRESTRSPHGPCRFAFVGRLHPKKGVLDLMSAVAQLRAMPGLPQFSVDLYGEGEQRPAIEAEIARLGLGDVVTLCGHTDRSQELLFGHDAFILPSYQEGNSNAILEAMVAQLPIISTRVGGTPMLVGEPGTHLLYEPGDVPQLTRLMQRLISDPALRSSIGMQMRRRALESFDIAHVARTYLNAYRLLAVGRRDEVFGVSNPVILEVVK